MKMSWNRALLGGAAVCVALTGCASVQPVKYSGIESSTYLTADANDKNGRIPFSYGEATDWSKYTKVLVEPVVIYAGADNQFGSMSDADKQVLARYMQETFDKKLGARFQLASTAGPDVLRIKLILTGAGTTKPGLGTFTHLDIGGNLYNGVQAIRGKEGAFSGYVIYAVELRDGATNHLLHAYVTKQYPNAMNLVASFGALHAAKTGIDKGADALVASLK
jgi:hypothetical protein